MIRKFTEFLNEDAATPSNVPGMGDVNPPSENEDGSGDVYDNGSFKKKKTLEELEKEANEKLDESSNEVGRIKQVILTEISNLYAYDVVNRTKNLKDEIDAIYNKVKILVNA